MNVDPQILSHLVYACGLIITALLSGIAAWVSHKMSRSVEQVNDAVNHRHTKGGPGAPKLYDAILHLHEKTDRVEGKADELIEWKRGYDGGPLDTGMKVCDFVDHVNELKAKIDSLEIRPPCAIHDDRLNALEKLVQIHKDQIKEIEDNQ